MLVKWLSSGMMILSKELLLFSKLSYWSIADKQCCDSFKWAEKGLNHTYAFFPRFSSHMGCHITFEQSSMCYAVGPCWLSILNIRSDQLLSRVWLFATPWIAAHQASLSITNSRGSLRLTSIESVMPSSHLILCRPLLLLPPSVYMSISNPVSLVPMEQTC